MKPVALMARCMENSTVIGDEIYDPFLGSGTTLVAAQQLGRRCFGIEISPRYVDVILTRWEKLTGKKATLQSPPGPAALPDATASTTLAHVASGPAPGAGLPVPPAIKRGPARSP